VKIDDWLGKPRSRTAHPGGRPGAAGDPLRGPSAAASSPAP